MIDEISRALAIFHGADQTIEIVFAVSKPGGNTAFIGKQFTTLQAAAEGAGKPPKGTAAVYRVVNPIDAEALNKHLAGGSGRRCCDDHIAKRKWVILDFDPVRPSGVCSTHAEKDAALDVANQVRADLLESNWPDPIVVDSGNGYHAFYACDLPNDDVTKSAIRDVLRTLDERFSSDGVNVDTTVGKAAQLMRLPGTTNRKGPDTPDRPHRPVSIVEAKDDARGRLVTLAQIQKVAGPPRQGKQSTEAAYRKLDGTAYLEGAGVAFRGPERDSSDSYDKWFAGCPCDPGHGGTACTDSYFFVGDNGATGFFCSHHSCDANADAFYDLHGKPSGECYIGGATAVEDFDVVDDETTIFDLIDGEKAGYRITPKIWTADQLDESKPVQLREPVVNGLIRVGDVANLINESKGGKTWNMLALAIAAARGASWLGMQTTKGNVLYLDNELHRTDFQFRLACVANKSGVRLTDIPNLNVENLRGRLVDFNVMEDYFAQIKRDQFQLVILDSFYRFLPPKCSENDNADMSRLYNQVARCAERLNAAFILVHHSSKGSQSDKSTTDVGSGAGAMSRAADAHIVIRRHLMEDHAVLDAAVRTFPPIEPFSLKWEFPIWTRSDEPPELKLRRTAADARQEKNDAEGIARLIETLTGETEPINEQQFRASTGFGDSRVKRLFNLAVDLGDVVVDRIGKTSKGKQTRFVRLPTDDERYGVESLF